MSKLDETFDLLRLDAIKQVRLGGSTSKAAQALLADQLSVDSADDLVVELTLSPVGDQAVTLSGQVAATVTQSCVLSGTPMTSRLEANVDLDVILEEDPMAVEALEVRELTGGPEPEYLPSGQLSLAKVVIDALLLEVDPYPRSEDVVDGVSLPKGVELNAPPAKRDNPFAALAVLKNK